MVLALGWRMLMVVRVMMLGGSPARMGAAMAIHLSQTEAMGSVGRHCLMGQCLWLFVVRVPTIGLVD